jgi:CheY-like chemotaxis protein
MATAAVKAPVLVVDDNAAFARTVVRLLESFGQPALAANSAYDAIDTLDEERSVGFVVADVRMPEIDGFDFVRVVRHRFPSLPVALMSAYPTDDDEVPPGVPLLVKPFEIEQLIALLKPGARETPGA